MVVKSEPTGILTFEEPRHLVENHASRLLPKGRELLSLLDTRDCILAEPIHADRGFPPFPRATRDGYALRSGDVEKLPAELRIVGEIKAGGASPVASLEPGQAIAIM